MKRHTSTLVAGLFGAPLLALILAALSRGWRFPALLPTGNTEGFLYLLSPASGVPAAVLASLALGIAVAIAAVLLALPAALVLTRKPSSRAILLLILLPASIPGLAVAMGLHALMLRLGLAGNLSGVFLLHLMPALAYAMLVLMNAGAAVDPSFRIAARGLGASRWQALVHVRLPMLRPAITLALALAFLVSWSQYGLTLLVSGGRVVTLPLVLSQFLGSGRLDIAGLVALLMLLPAVLLLGFSARSLGTGKLRG